MTIWIYPVPDTLAPNFQVPDVAWAGRLDVDVGAPVEGAGAPVAGTVGPEVIGGVTGGVVNTA